MDGFMVNDQCSDVDSILTNDEQMPALGLTNYLLGDIAWMCRVKILTSPAILLPDFFNSSLHVYVILFFYITDLHISYLF